MSVTISEDTEEIIVTSEPSEVVTVENVEIQVSMIADPITAVPTNEIELIITSDEPALQLQFDDVEIVVQTVADSIVKELYLVDHGSTDGLTHDDHLQYHNDIRGDLRYTPISHVSGGDVNPHGLAAAGLPGLSNWGLRVTPADQAFILANMETDSVPSTRIQSLVAGKIAAGVMAAKISLADIFTASKYGSIFNDDQAGILLGEDRISMGFIDDGGGLPIYMLRHSNGYASNHPNYISNFSVDENGNVDIAGTLRVGAGSSGIDQFNDAGVLATKDRTTYYQTTEPTGPELAAGDIWYDTDNGNTPYRYSGSIWESIKDADIAVAQGSIDGKIRTYWQGTAPTGLTAADNGDLWFDTSNGNKVYFYDDTAISEPIPKWRDAQDSDIAQSISDAATAQSTADGKVTTYAGASFPVYVDVNNTGTEGIGDLFYHTGTKITYRALVFPVGLIYDPLEWEIIGNGFDETGLLTDTADLGGTANWSTVVDDNGNAPADNADVTDIGGTNYVVRGLAAPNTFTVGTTQVVVGEGDWGFVLQNSTSASQIFSFDTPVLRTDTNYVVGFWASSSINGTELLVDLTEVGLPQYSVILTTTPTYYTYSMTSNSAAMAIATLRFLKLTSTAVPAGLVTIYDTKLEQGSQSTEWTPYKPVDDGAENTVYALERGAEISEGGVTLGGTSAIHTSDKDAYGDITAGVYLGWDVTEANYVLDVGNNTNYVRWDGINLIVKGKLTLSGSATELTETNTLNVNTTSTDVGLGSVTDGADVTADNQDFAYNSLTGTKPPTNADNTNTQIEATLEITQGGIVFGDGTTDGGGIRSFSKSSFADTDAGFFLGWDTIGGSAYKFNIGDASNFMSWDGSSLAITGNINGSTITGGTVQTSPTSDRIVLNGSTNQVECWGDLGLGVVLSATLGVKLDGSDYIIFDSGTVSTTSIRTAVRARSGNGVAVEAKTFGTGTAVNSESISGVAVKGVSTNSYGGDFSSTNDLGLNCSVGNNTSGSPFRVAPSGSPSFPTHSTNVLDGCFWLTSEERYFLRKLAAWKEIGVEGTSLIPRAWVSYTVPLGTGVLTVRDSYGVTGMTDAGVGLAYVSLSIALPTQYPAIIVGASYYETGSLGGRNRDAAAHMNGTSTVIVNSYSDSDGAIRDVAKVSLTIFD